MGTTTPPNLLLPTSVPCSSTTTCGCFTVLLIIINYMGPHGDRVCSNLGCNASVALRVCRGTKNPENRGHWYEAVCPILLFLKPKLTATIFQCTAPAHLSHFICWRYDITPSADFVSSVKNPPRTFQDLLQIPITPLKTTPRVNSSSRAVPPLPALTIPPAPTVTLEAPLEHHAGVTATTDHFHDEENTGPTDLESLGALDGNATVVARAASGTPSPSSAKSAGASVSPSHTRILVINGSARTVCNGPICRVQKKDPPRPCSTCSYQYCKKCCLRYQEQTRKHCKEARHACAPSKVADTTTTSGPLTSETGATASISELQLHKPNPANRPLRQEHYDAQQRSEREWRVEANRLTLQKAVEERLKRNINIYFWNSVSYMTYGPGH